MTLLDGLDHVDWESLHHAYGPATDVPELLRALFNPKLASRRIQESAESAGRTVTDEVTWQLWGNVFHQGSVWQATAHTVPFFEQILRDRPADPEVSEFLVTYLHHLAMSYPTDLFPTPFDIEGLIQETEGIVDPGGEPDYGGDMQVASVWVRDTYLAVEQTVPTVAELSHSANEAVACEAIAFTASFPRRSDISVPILLRIAEVDGALRFGHALVSLAMLAPDLAVVEAQKALDSSDAVVRLFAACATVLAAPEQADEACVNILTQRHDKVAERRCAHTATLGILVGRSASLLQQKHRMRAIIGIAEQHIDAPPITSLSLTASLLRIAFGDDHAPESASDLDPEQRATLESIRDHGGFTINGSSFTNYAQLLRAWGLPAHRDALTAWLGTG